MPSDFLDDGNVFCLGTDDDYSRVIRSIKRSGPCLYKIVKNILKTKKPVSFAFK